MQILIDKHLQKKHDNCRVIAINEYSLELQAQRYIQLYQQILQNFKN